MANNTEFQIGEEFQCGLVRLKCVAQREDLKDMCNGCFFDNGYQCPEIEDIYGECLSDNRQDKTNVIFVKVEE